MIPVILGVIFIVFFLLKVTPGDPARTVLGTDATEEEIAAWNEARGLDKPFLVQYVDYVVKVVTRLDFGESYSNGRPVAGEIKTRLPNSLVITFWAIFLMTALGVPIGVISAIHPYTWKDNILMTGSLVFVSMPGFWLGLMMSLLFALKLGWLPASGLYGPKYYILPIASLALQQMASIARMTRSCMLDVVGQDYIVTARAKGVSEKTITYKHALKNALIPIITSLGNSGSTLLGGAVITEAVFSIPGMGSYIVNSIKGRDYPAVLGAVLALALCASLILLISDLAYAFVDPRIRAQYGGAKKQKKEAQENG